MTSQTSSRRRGTRPQNQRTSASVGANKLAQLWKQGAFDADWHWEMRGATRPAGEDGDAAEETRGLGERKEPPGETQRGRTLSARMEIQDQLRGKK